MRQRDSVEFGVVTLLGNESHRPSGINGLPAASSSTRMVGRFPYLASLSHPNLCSYIELIRSTTVSNAVFLISEYYAVSLADELQKLPRLDLKSLVHISTSILSALEYLHSKNIVLGYFALNSVFLLGDVEDIRLGQYGLHYLSGGGRDVDCCIASPWYLSPERLRNLSYSPNAVFRASDIWAFGVVLVELAVGVVLSDIWGIRQIFAVLKTSIEKAVDGSAFTPLLDAIRMARPGIEISIDPKLVTLLKKVLSIRPSQRPKAKQLLKEFVALGEGVGVREVVSTLPRWRLSSKRNLDLLISDLEKKIDCESLECFGVRSPEESFYLWKLSGSSVENILLNHGVIKANSPINMLPLIIADDCCMYGNGSSRRCFSTFLVFILPSNNFRERMAAIDKRQFLVNFELEEEEKNNLGLSLIVKEKDIEYQARRMLVLSRLIEAFPFKKALLRDECAVDIPPLHRGAIWFALLNLSSYEAEKFHLYDTFSEHTSDRQLMVDIPRCHQYDELMASPAAHCKLKRLLKTWLLAHPNYVYWQGLDSLAAPFLVLHFTDLAKAFASLEAFISLYLHNFFLQDNSPVIQEYLAVFFHLLAYVDAQLYSHLTQMEFFPELFAIPWFLTCFAHVLPLHKLFHVWDVLILADSSFPLFVGLAIMEQLRSRLINASFNDAILLFSDLPDLNIERIVQDSEAMYSMVPASCTYRSHSSTHLRGPISLKPFTVDELKELCCPRISVEDFVRLFDDSAVLIIDIRTQQEFSRGALTGSVNYPYNETEPLELIQTALKNAQGAGHCVAIVGNHHPHRANKIAQRCISAGFSRVCVLDGGIDNLRSVEHCFSCSF